MVLGQPDIILRIVCQKHLDERLSPVRPRKSWRNNSGQISKSLMLIEQKKIHRNEQNGGKCMRRSDKKHQDILDQLYMNQGIKSVKLGRPGYPWSS